MAKIHIEDAQRKCLGNQNLALTRKPHSEKLPTMKTKKNVCDGSSHLESNKITREGILEPGEIQTVENMLRRWAMLINREGNVKWQCTSTSNFRTPTYLAEFTEYVAFSWRMMTA